MSQNALVRKLLPVIRERERLRLLAIPMLMPLVDVSRSRARFRAGTAHPRHFLVWGERNDDRKVTAGHRLSPKLILSGRSAWMDTTDRAIPQV